MIILTSDFSVACNEAATEHLDPLLSHNTTLIVLTQLRINGPQRPRDLRRSLGLTTGGTSNLLGRLESAGLITRRAPRSGDERAVVVELAAHGRAGEAEVNRVLVEALQRSAVTLKELMMTLEHLGARMPRSRRRTETQRERSQLVFGLAAVGEQLKRALRTDDVDPQAAIIIVAISDVGACRPRYLANRCGLTTAGITNALNRLEADGLVRRSAGDDADQRAVLVSLTTRGESAVRTILTNVDGQLDDFADAIVAVGRAVADTETAS